jgi:hypothetical protein
VSGESGGRPYASGVWQEIASDRRRIILGGYETATPPLDTFEWDPQGMPRSYGTYTGSTMFLMLEVGGRPGPFRVALPDGEGASVIYASQAKLNAIDTTFMMQRGAVNVTAVSIEEGLASASGTFSGAPPISPLPEVSRPWPPR